MKTTGLLFLGIGTVFVSVSLLLRLYQIRMERICTAEVSGVIVDYVRRSVNGGDRTWRPVIEYRANGQTYRKHGVIGSTRRPYPTGQAVTVRYDPADPDRFYAVEFGTGDGLKTAFLLSGLALAVVGIGILLAGTGGRIRMR